MPNATWRGGWKVSGNGSLDLRAQGRVSALFKLFYNPRQPGLDDYYEPWTYRYGDLFDAPPGEEQPSARPVSQITGDTINIAAGPNWDDDLSGSSVYAENDPNLKVLDANERQALFTVERMTMSYLLRICNHCVKPVRCALQAGRGRHRSGQPGQKPRLACVRRGMPVQEGLLQLEDRQS